MSRRPLSKEQIRQIGIARSAAFQHQLHLGAVVFPPDLVKASKKDQADFWAHQQISAVTPRVCSSRDMIDDEYIPVKLHFEALAGPGYQTKAVKTLGKAIEGAACDQAPGCEYLRDMHQWLSQAGYAVGYAVAIAKAKFRGETNFRRLTTGQLKQLHDTVVNRCRAKLGLGDADHRNIKQRGRDVLSVLRSKTAKDECRVRDVAPEPAPSTGPSENTATLPVSQPPVPKERTYILKPRPSADDLPSDKKPF